MGSGNAVLGPAGQHGDVVAFGPGSLPGLDWLGDGIGQALADGWKAAMSALWSAGLWVLQLAFKVIDAFTTPDLSTSGPLAKVLPHTFYLGAVVAVLLALIQIGAAAWRRDGQSLGRVLVGTVQFGLVWVGYITCAAVLVTASAGLTKGLLDSLLGIDVFAGFSETSAWPREVTDATVATVLGVCTVFLIFPAAIGYLLIMLVREAALLLLVATSPITAAGLLSEGTKVWFWKSLRWFIASVLMAPLMALVLGIGVKMTEGVIGGNGNDTAAAVGTAVVGSVLILMGAVCPLILFRLLAFVDPGTSTGAAMRTSFTAAGGLTGLLGGGGGGGADAGSGAATKQDGQGRSQGESSADSQTSSRFGGMLGALGQGSDKLASIGMKAAAVGSDVLEMGGVGHQAPYYGQSSSDGAAPGGGSGGQPDQGGGQPGGQTDDQAPPPPPPPTPPMPPMPAPPTPPMPGGDAGPAPVGGGNPAAGSGGAGDGAGAAAEVPIVPV